jgi:hypothetical protein
VEFQEQYEGESLRARKIRFTTFHKPPG